MTTRYHMNVDRFDSIKRLPAKKQCTRCRKIKPRSEFYFRGDVKSKMYAHCKRCVGDHMIRYRLLRKHIWKK